MNHPGKTTESTGKKGDVVRLFICITLPEFIKKDLGTVQSGLKKNRVKASWPRPDAMHLTLRFLGPVKRARIDPLSRTLSRIGPQTRPFKLRAAGIGIFPSNHRARVIWAGVGGQTHILGTLVSQINEALEADQKIKPEEKPFLPHLTLARFRQPPDRDQLAGWLASFRQFSSPFFTVRRFCLMKSRLLASGARHEPILSVDLGS